MVNNQLYILLKKKNEKKILKELFRQKEINLIEECQEDTTWRTYNRQNQIMNRNNIRTSNIRSDWFLKHLHDKMNYMRS
ncbi:hypothetical protein [Tepidibacillus marianensis]|uniref:hypothetical protein n=1 Tax=Tepidibacillus marianensis TaxID=3131995 RepID=UPI0030CBC739